MSAAISQMSGAVCSNGLTVGGAVVVGELFLNHTVVKGDVLLVPRGCIHHAKVFHEIH